MRHSKDTWLHTPLIGSLIYHPPFCKVRPAGYRLLDTERQRVGNHPVCYRLDLGHNPRISLDYDGFGRPLTLDELYSLCFFHDYVARRLQYSTHLSHCLRASATGLVGDPEASTGDEWREAGFQVKHLVVDGNLDGFLVPSSRRGEDHHQARRSIYQREVIPYFLQQALIPAQAYG